MACFIDFFVIFEVFLNDKNIPLNNKMISEIRKIIINLHLKKRTK